MILGLLLLPVALALLPILLLAGIVWLIARRDRDSNSGPDKAQPPSTEPILPSRNYFLMKEESINYYWSRAFYDHLESFTGNANIYTDHEHGLIYYYIVDDQVRYIGQTRENSLRWRMTRPQAGGQIGYNLFIKRNMLEAASKGGLAITTKVMPKARLNDYERSEIEKYALANRLWNQEHNPSFNVDNFYEN